MAKFEPDADDGGAASLEPGAGVTDTWWDAGGAFDSSMASGAPVFKEDLV